jgi:deferrochelatase/peroxidase EfeB
MDETTSRHLRNASEVLLWIPIKNDFAHFDEQIVSYATRLSLFLRGVFELRRDSTERRGLDSAGPVERLQIVYNVQWTVLVEERRLLVAASFDRSWETYFRELADTTGSLLDAIFCHCEGFEANTCADSFDTFMGWIRKYQRPCDFFFAAAPDLTTDDFRYLKLLSRVAEPGLLTPDTVASRIMLKPPGETAPHARAENIEKALWSLYELRKLFTDDVKLGATPKDPAAVQAAIAALESPTAIHTLQALKTFARQSELAANAPVQRSEREIFDGAISALFFSEAKGLQEAIERLELQFRRALGAGESLAVLARCKDVGELLGWARSLVEPELVRKRKLVGATQQAGVEQLDNRDLEAIQGGILTDYPRTTHGVMALIQCDTRASFREFLKAMQPRITSERTRISVDERADPKRIWINLGLTYHGLERLGLPESVLLQFPKEFREGMEARAGLLGDIGDPDYPLETGPVAKGGEAAPRVRMSTVDAVVLMQTNRRDLGAANLDWWTDRKNPFRDELARLQKIGGVRVLSEQPLQRQFEGDSPREHFGYVEGGKPGSQPVPRVVYTEQPSAGPAYEAAALRDSVRLGEIFLGYKNQRGEPERTVSIGKGESQQELLKHGSFMVVRKLRQNVGVFRDFVAQTADRLGIEPSTFKGFIAGRAPNGESLIPCASNNGNDFHFDADPDGLQCPHYAHIRRSNPRSRGEGTLVPRILRRGFSYGPSCPERSNPAQAIAAEKEDRGLVFMAYNANIAEQFEVIQRWINGGNRTGLLSTQQDLLAGQGPISQAAYWHRGGRSDADKQFGPPAKPVVSLQWGAYLFVPSIRALDALQRPLEPDASAAAERGEEIIRRLLAFECEQRRLRTMHEQASKAQQGRAEALARERLLAAEDLQKPGPSEQPIELTPEAKVWKKVLEEAGGSDASDVWQAVRLKYNGALRTAYGVLVANLELAELVLGDDGSAYSVREYGKRLGALLNGPHYLGIDRYDDDYAALAHDPNRFANTKITASAAFASARKFARAALEQAPAIFGRQETRVRRLAEIVVLQLCNEWFGLPLEEERLNAIVFSSRYAFQPAPGVWLHSRVKDQAGVIGRPLADRSLLGENLRSYAPKENAVALALNGAMIGFAAPAIASIVTILDAWSADGALWRLSEQVREGRPDEYEDAAGILLQPTLDALGRRPVPSLLYRFAEPKAVGSIAPRHEVRIEANDRVIVGLGAVYQDACERRPLRAEQWLFGGDYTAAKGPAKVEGTPTSHGCPARDAALATFLGVFAAVLSLPNLRLERRYVVSYSDDAAAGGAASAN